MPIVFAAVTPHPPALIPGIGKEAGESALQKTREALKKLEQDLYTSHPDLIIIISPHEGLHEKAFVVNANPVHHSNYEEFGDLATKQTWKGGSAFATFIARAARHGKHKMPVRLISQDKVSHGTSVPLSLLTEHLQEIPVVPVGFSGMGTAEHIAFGKLIKEVIMANRKRVAIIASGDLSHCLTEKSPATYAPEGKEFDTKIRKILDSGDNGELAYIDEKLIKKANECGFRSILILLGILQDMDTKFEELCYEHPLGVGYLTGQFHL